MTMGIRYLLPAALLVAACSDSDKGTDPPDKVPYEWSLDLNLAGDAVFTGLNKDTSAVAAVRGEISGKVNGLDTSLVKDTLRFLNVEYEDFHVETPLGADGSFRFDPYDLMGDLDGSMTILIWLMGKRADRPPTPDTLVLELDRP